MFRLEATPGSMPARTQVPSTHKAVFDQAAKRGAVPFAVGQEIDGQPPFEWLIGEREFAQYRVGRLEDPTRPVRFRRPLRYGWPTLIEEYLADRDYLYALDADHAMLALPLRVMELAVQHTGNKFDEWLTEETRDCIDKSARAGRRRLSQLARMIL